MRSIHALPAKSLLGRRRRFFFLGLAVTFGFFIMTLTTGLTEGLLRAVREKGAFYFSGNINVIAYAPGGTFSCLDKGLLADASAALPGAEAVFRTIYYSTDAQIFFNGASVRQRRLIGVDWGKERSELRKMYFSQGAAPEGEGKDSILLSDTAARRLGAGLGATVTVLAFGEKGKNTAPFVVRGIFRDSSLFGYAAYLGRDDLNALLSHPAGYATDLALYLPGGMAERQAAERLRTALAKRAQVFPLVVSRDQQAQFTAQSWEGLRYMVCTLDAHLSDIKTALDAIAAVCYALLGVFLVIVLLGISNTYRVVVYQRGAEIGTMRALGLGKSGAVLLLVEEAGILAAVSSAAGLALGVLGLLGLSSVDFSANRGLDMFLDRGHLAWALDAKAVLGIFIVVCAATLLAAWLPARKAASIEPVEAMRSEE